MDNNQFNKKIGLISSMEVVCGTVMEGMYYKQKL